MFKKNYKLAKIVLIVCIFVLSNSKEAFSKTDTLKFKSWGQPLVISDVNKSWLISFSHKIKDSTINNYNIFIEDENGNKLETTSSALNDSKTIKISPSKPYEDLKSYKLFIEDKIENEEGKQLNIPVFYEFKIDLKSKKDSINEVITSVNSLFTAVNIKTSSKVYKVYVDNEEAKYKGNNEYNSNIIGKKIGDKLKIKTYDSDNNLIDETDYTINK
ncbi:hypothetical protein CLHOM_21550 [Clostridium homopropionicum DSM 5847]|uniref:SbsA Ig-like domain-containing protein n=1 Tax=Clostridium homopropionicum DSM 5847 TaxID=1121318 RepID=A0A0L6Z8S3_9CLOT|nr:Ig-like domain-containing protein [Clostridium homopropionicum]KOA19364.1 hypothetical protein CLHOM_21550 [Clostridium homopropionicum DSM 5847]SFG67550.1 hypothetical protein SAMN04488501_1134 [Clostridium homopropionicum]